MAAAGTLLSEPIRPLVALPSLDPRNAAARALAGYLSGLTFRRSGGVAAPDATFQLVTVRGEWPEPDRPMEYPCASLIDSAAVPMEAHSLTPTPMEDTWNSETGSVLWKLAEAAFTFQVDFWCNTGPTRESVAARIPGAFSPGEATARIVISAGPEYYCLGVRAALLSFQRMDTPDSVYPRERRLMAMVRCEIDVVEQRCAPAFMPLVRFVEVGEEVDVTLPEPDQLCPDPVRKE